MSNIDIFFNAYLACALWSTNDESDECGGNPLDRNYSTFDFDDESAQEMRDECIAFINENESLLEQAGDSEQNGHDFWLTRNGHGAGFWDRGYPKRIGDALSKAAREAGEVYLYVENGIIYKG